MKPITDIFRVTGLTCADCAAKLEAKLRATTGIDEVSLNFMTEKLTVRHHLTAPAIVHLIEEAGYGAFMASKAPPPALRAFFLKRIIVYLPLSFRHFAAARLGTVRGHRNPADRAAAAISRPSSSAGCGRFVAGWLRCAMAVST